MTLSLAAVVARTLVVAALLLLAVWTTSSLDHLPQFRTRCSKTTSTSTSTAAPSYVLDYAPYVYLQSIESFLPTPIDSHLAHITPRLNYTRIYNLTPNLTNIDSLNELGQHVYLTSKEDPSVPAHWLQGNPPHQGLSDAPVFIIWTRKPGGVVDAFYFYFYSFNLGNTVATVRFGNHVGDWEHTAVRFRDGVPESMFFSQHEGGSAYDFDAVEKIGKRPVSYSAAGSHANYATPGIHYYAIPFHLLADTTDRGTLWDAKQNFLLYEYDIGSDTLVPDEQANPGAETGWFYYNGRWGDKSYPMDDRRQYQVVGQYHWVDGPTGPRWKNLRRRGICQNENACRVWNNRFVGKSGRTEEEELRVAEEAGAKIETQKGAEIETQDWTRKQEDEI